MRVLIVSQYYPPEPVPLPADLAKGLASRGHEVTVITGFPNYPSGKIAPGYRQRWRSREMDGAVEVHRVPLFADHSQSALRRTLNYGSFALSSATMRRVSRGVDVVYVYATQMTAGLGPWLWRISGGRPYVLHVQDLWPDSVIGSSMITRGALAQTMASMLAVWLRSAYRRASAVIGIAPTMVATLQARGVPRGRAHLVYNWADSAEPAVGTRSEEAGERVRIVYAGNVGDMQDLGTAVRAAHASADAGLELTIVGDGVAKDGLRALVAEIGALNVRFEDPVPRERMRQVYRRTDFALVSLRDMPAFRGTIPSKFQAAMAAGVPVITTVQGDLRRLVEEDRVGLAADAENVASLEAAFRAASALSAGERVAMVSRAHALHVARFSRDSAITSIERLLTAAAHATRSEA